MFYLLNATETKSLGLRWHDAIRAQVQNAGICILNSALDQDTLYSPKMRRKLNDLVLIPEGPLLNTGRGEAESWGRRGPWCYFYPSCSFQLCHQMETAVPGFSFLGLSPRKSYPALLEGDWKAVLSDQPALQFRPLQYLLHGMDTSPVK